MIWPQLVGFARAKEYLFTDDLMTAAEAELIGLINHVVPVDQLDEKVSGLARRLADGAMRSIRWTKQIVNLPLRQLAHSMMAQRRLHAPGAPLDSCPWKWASQRISSGKRITPQACSK